MTNVEQGCTKKTCHMHSISLFEMFDCGSECYVFTPSLIDNTHLFMCSTKHYRERPLLVSPGWNLFIDPNIHIFLGERIRNLC